MRDRVRHAPGCSKPFIRKQRRLGTLLPSGLRHDENGAGVDPFQIHRIKTEAEIPPTRLSLLAHRSFRSQIHAKTFPEQTLQRLALDSCVRPIKDCTHCAITALNHTLRIHDGYAFAECIEGSLPLPS